MDQKLVVFLKWPEKGRVKTRLASAIGDEEAVRVYKWLVEETLRAARPFAGKTADVILAYDPPEREAEIRSWITGPFQFWPQGKGDLGQRLSATALSAFRDGARKVQIIGSDCPSLCGSTLRRGFQALSKKDVVIGPSEDGGYYLIGLRRAGDVLLFDGVPWSTPGALAATLKKADDLKLSCELLPKKSDIDTADDLKRLEKISVIIPALNEEPNIGPLLADLTDRHNPDEIWVADGGSRDRTRAVAAKYARVIQTEAGRAVQMNAGAAAADGDILVFLHADTRLPDGALPKVRGALESGKNSGRFRLSFGHPHPLLRLYEFQTRFHRFSYGDQGFFIRKKLFQKMGGFRTDAAFEDIDFYRRLLKFERPVIIPDPVVTSPRRFLANGIVRQKFINIALVTLAHAGLSRQAVGRFQKKWYKDVRHAEFENA